MKALASVAVVAVGLLAGFGVATVRNSNVASQMALEVESLRAEVEQTRVAERKAVASSSNRKNEIEQLRGQAAEVHRLRAEVSRLKTELADVQTARDRLAAVKEKNVAQERVTPDSEKQREKKEREKVIPAENAPPAVAAVVAQQMAGAAFNGLHVSRDEGRTSYGAKGKLPDGRTIAMRVAEDGTLMERSLEIPAEMVPGHIQTSVAQTFNGTAISSAREIFDGGVLSYELAGKGPDSRSEIRIRDDGTILSYSTKLRAPEEKRK